MKYKEKIWTYWVKFFGKYERKVFPGTVFPKKEFLKTVIKRKKGVYMGVFGAEGNGKVW